jgi:hypothetical protein
MAADCQNVTEAFACLACSNHQVQHELCFGYERRQYQVLQASESVQLQRNVRSANVCNVPALLPASAQNCAALQRQACMTSFSIQRPAAALHLVGPLSHGSFASPPQAEQANTTAWHKDYRSVNHLPSSTHTSTVL